MHLPITKDIFEKITILSTILLEDYNINVIFKIDGAIFLHSEKVT